MPTFYLGLETTCSLRLDQTQVAASDNGCIDKFKLWMDIVIPAGLSTFVHVSNIGAAQIPLDTPMFQNIGGYVATHDSPFFSLQNQCVAFVSQQGTPTQIDWHAYGLLRFGVPATDYPVEFWIHRTTGVDIASAAFEALYYDPSATTVIYHFALPAGTEFKFRSTYFQGVDLFFNPISSTAESNIITLASASCSSGGSGGGGGGDEDACPCEWTAGGLPTTTWAAGSHDCASYTASALPTTTWTKQGCP